MTDAEAITLLGNLETEADSMRQSVIADYGTIDAKSLATAREIRDALNAAQQAQ